MHMVTYNNFEAHIRPESMLVRNGNDRAYGKMCAFAVGKIWDWTYGNGHRVDYKSLEEISFDFNPLDNSVYYVMFNNSASRMSEAHVQEWFAWEWDETAHKYMAMPKCEIIQYLTEMGKDSEQRTLWIDPDRFYCTPFGIDWSTESYKLYHNIYEYYTDHARERYEYYVPRIENNKLFIEKVGSFDELEKYIDDDAR